MEWRNRVILMTSNTGTFGKSSTHGGLPLHSVNHNEFAKMSPSTAVCSSKERIKETRWLLLNFVEKGKGILFARL